jgi:D-inositol-3-phosphate glycosyltransferase
MSVGLLLRNLPWTPASLQRKGVRRPGFLTRFFRPGAQYHTHAVYGAHVASEALIDSLLRYRTEEYHIFVPPHLVNAFQDQPKTHPQEPRIHSFYELPAGSSGVQITNWFDPWPNFGILSYVRSTWSRKLRPAVILHHTLSYSRSLHQIVLPILLADSFPCDSIVCTSRPARQALKMLLDCVACRLEEGAGFRLRYNGRLDLIPLGVDTELFRPRDKSEVRRKFGLPPDACVVLFLGRLSFLDKADLHPLLSIFREIVGQQKSAQRLLLVLAGSDRGNYILALEGYIVELGLKKSVRVIIQPQEPHLLIAGADILTSPADSVEECFGLSVIEAMASGVPQIVSDWNGYRDTVEHGVTGFLVPTYWSRCDSDICQIAPVFGNQWDFDHAMLGQSVVVDCAKLKEYLELLIGNPNLRAEMGKRARERALTFYRWPVIVRQYEQLWSDLRQAAGEQPLRSPSRMSYTQPSYFDVFSHYATRLLDDASELEITPLGKALLAEKGPKLINYPAIRMNLLQMQLLMRMLAALDGQRIPHTPNTDSGQTIVEVVTMLTEDRKAHHADQIKRHILWLLKHGYLQWKGRASSRKSFTNLSPATEIGSTLKE